MSNRLRNIFFFVGLAAVIIMILTFKVSFVELWEQLTHAGHWLVVILGMWVVLYAMNALTWRTIIKGSGTCNIPFLHLLKVTISGFSLNYATPVGLMGGEPYKIMEMKPYIGVQRASSSVLLFAMMHIFTHFWYWLTAVVLYVIFIPLDIPISFILLLLTAFCVGAIYLFTRGYKNGMVVKGIHFLARIPGLKNWAKRFEVGHYDDLVKIDTQIAALHSQKKRNFYVSFFLEYIGRILQSLEIYFMLLIFTDQGANWMTFVYSIIILAFTSLFANMMFFMPLQLGGREGGFAMSIAQMGMTGQVAMSVSIICRVRELFWTALGLLLIKVGNKEADALRLEEKERKEKVESEKKDMNLKFAILAAGEGSRLAREGVSLPKPLVPVHGEAMIDRLVRIFMDCGASEILIITNNLTELTKAHLQQMVEQGLPVKYIVKTTPSSMHSFNELKPYLGKGKFCLTTVDTIFREREFKRYINAFKASEKDGLMAVTDFVDDEKPLWVSTNTDLMITGFHDSQELFNESAAGQDGVSICKYISGGIYCLSEKSFDVLNKCIAEGQSRMRNFQRQMVFDGLQLEAYPFSKILDVDHADDIAKAEAFLAEE